MKAGTVQTKLEEFHFATNKTEKKTISTLHQIEMTADWC